MEASRDQSKSAAILTRRGLLGGAAAGVAIASFADDIQAATRELECASPLVETAYGKVRGLIRAGVREFKGIPYGASTGGSNRFLPPRKPASWTGVREALTYGNPCPQHNPWGVFFVDSQPASEDCLVLNVWTPADVAGDAKLPVMVWFHGGGFESESGGVPGYSGDQLSMSGNVVVVTLNHRLNIFGYFHLGRQADERFASSGNVGHLDLVAALEWVRDNIAGFGGDPTNVTIFGESGGGGKVIAAIAMPAMRGLFHKAIVQSGPYLEALEPDKAFAMTAHACKYLGVALNDIPALQAVPVIKLKEAYRHVKSADLFGSEVRYGPVVDGQVLLRHPWVPQAPDTASHIPMMIGTTSEEEALFLGEALRETIPDEQLATRIAAKVRFIRHQPEDYAALIDTYRKAMPGAPNDKLLVRIATDAGWWRPALLQAERKLAAGGPPVFMYEFGWKVPFMSGEWAIHGTDLPFMLGHPDYAPAWSADDSQALREASDIEGRRYGLAQHAMKCWAAFAWTGNPSTDELRWPEYDLVTRPVMLFDRETRLVEDPRGFAREQIRAL